MLIINAFSTLYHANITGNGYIRMFFIVIDLYILTSSL